MSTGPLLATLQEGGNTDAVAAGDGKAPLALPAGEGKENGGGAGGEGADGGAAAGTAGAAPGGADLRLMSEDDYVAYAERCARLAGPCN